MTSAAQVQADRANAPKSTGPRTAEGKAVAAQNAVRHGLLAKEVVVKGEDPGEFELYRRQMLAELAPVGQMQEMLTQRIVGLSWRLRRAERLQAAAFDKVEDRSKPSQPTMSSEDAAKIRAFMVEQNIRLSYPADASPAFGRKAVQDFNLERVLDRLLVYERRIEHSLYRTMAELRLVRKEGVSSGKCEAASSTGVPPVTAEDIHGQACPELAEGEDCDIHGQDARATHGRDAHATEPEGGTANESRQTKPIGAEVSSVKSEVSSVLPASNIPLETPDQPPQGGTPNKACETKPIQKTGSTPSNTPAQPRPARKFPNTVNEETYDSYLGRWIWTGYAFAHKDSKQADAGRRQ